MNRPVHRKLPDIGEVVAHFTILERLGGGGMGVVFTALDNSLHRRVALKFLSEAVSSDPQALDRFQREARSASALNHPNICTIYEIGQHRGQHFIAMELLEGRTLAEHVGGRPLPTDEVLDLAVQIADGLAAAHEQGIIHRDIKPANIFVTGRHLVKLLDFGLAKPVLARPAAADKTLTADAFLTAPGTVPGTAAYMSPEQACGEDLDARSDIFSFGAVLYEMATGRQAFSGKTMAVLFDAILHQAPASAARLNSKIPGGLESIIAKALEKDRRLRYQRAADLREDLRRLRRGLEPAVGRSTLPTGTKPPGSLAVLPFTNLSAEKENEYFSDGLAEEIINALTRLPGLRVTARTSSFAFRGKDADVREIGARLNVEHILEGSVRKAGNRIRVTAQLVSASDGLYQWSGRYDRELTDVFAIQDEICQALVDKLRVELVEGRPLVKRYTENVEAYNLYLKARYHLYKFTPEGLSRSKDYFEQAVAVDPNYALAWCGLAGFYWHLGFFGYLPPRAAIEGFGQATSKALELDDLLPDAHADAALLRVNDYDWKGAEPEFERALELAPWSDEVSVLYDYYYLVPMKRLEDAVAASRAALDLDPLSPFLQWRLGYRYYLIRQWDRAIEQCQSALELDPHYFAALAFLAFSRLQQGGFDEAILTLENAARFMGRGPLSLGWLGLGYGRSGRTEEAKRILAELQEVARQTYVLPSSIAEVHIGLGDLDGAFEWFGKAIDERDKFALHIHVDPTFDALRTDPRYPALIRRMNLDP